MANHNLFENRVYSSRDTLQRLSQQVFEACCTPFWSTKGRVICPHKPKDEPRWLFFRFRELNEIRTWIQLGGIALQDSGSSSSDWPHTVRMFANTEKQLRRAASRIDLRSHAVAQSNWVHYELFGPSLERALAKVGNPDRIEWQPRPSIRRQSAAGEAPLFAGNITGNITGSIRTRIVADSRLGGKEKRVSLSV